MVSIFFSMQISVLCITMHSGSDNLGDMNPQNTGKQKSEKC